MKRLIGALSAISLLLPFLALSQASPRFDVKLPPEKQITHVLSRLTFGARPADVAEVRRVGIERWIDLQLNPERIPESSILETRLEPLSSLNLQTWQLFEKYQQPQQVMVAPPRIAPASVLSPLQMSKLMNGGTVE